MTLPDRHPVAVCRVSLHEISVRRDLTVRNCALALGRGPVSLVEANRR